ncbi:MAG: hypothetical protein HKK67_10520 [Chlorobiaceae bacterium]|nr:hypothetical protein [Chlorobiaceae bacterium]
MRRYKMHRLVLHSATEPEWSFVSRRGLCLRTRGIAAALQLCGSSAECVQVL